MEKKRRARINASLAELKSLLLDVMKSEVKGENQSRVLILLNNDFNYMVRFIHRKQNLTLLIN